MGSRTPKPPPRRASAREARKHEQLIQSVRTMPIGTIHRLVHELSSVAVEDIDAILDESRRSPKTEAPK